MTLPILRYGIRLSSIEIPCSIEMAARYIARHPHHQSLVQIVQHNKRFHISEITKCRVKFSVRNMDGNDSLRPMQLSRASAVAQRES